MVEVAPGLGWNIASEFRGNLILNRPKSESDEHRGLRLPFGIGGEIPSLACYPTSAYLIAGGWMNRREFVTLLGAAAASWPLAARAQRPERMRRIGVLMAFEERDAVAQSWIAAMRDGLRKLGWTQGHNIHID
jgi:hypothetical protein